MHGPPPARFGLASGPWSNNSCNPKFLLLARHFHRAQQWSKPQSRSASAHLRSRTMRIQRILNSPALIVLFLLLAFLAAARSADSNNSIQGIVTGPTGPEAGVWVIAETTGLPTRFAKIVVTD